MDIGKTNILGWNHPPCPNCKELAYQTFTITQRPIFKEGNREESNAERVRQQAQAKRLKEERDKLGDKDPEAVRAEQIRQQRDFEDQSPEGP